MQRKEKRPDPVIEEEVKQEAVTIAEPAPIAGLPSMFLTCINIYE